MKNILYIRWLHIKRHAVSVLLGLLLPVVATISLVAIFQTVKEDATIPVAIIVEEETQLVKELVREIEENPLYRTHERKERQALNQLQKNDLDSVFIIKKNYEKQVEAGNRNRLIQGYASDMSIAYPSTAEMIQAIVQEQASRYKAIHEITNLHSQFNRQREKTDEQLIVESKQIEADQQLLQTTMDYAGTNTNKSVSANTINPVEVWAYLVMLGTFFLFDWVLKEKHADVAVRFLYTKQSLKTYLLQHFLLYTTVLFILDVITMCLFEWLYGGMLSLRLLAALLFYRILLNSSAFLISFVMRKVYVYYLVSLTITLLAIVTSLLDIVTASPLFTWLHPTAAFLQGDYWNIWLIINVLCIILISLGKERDDVTSKTIT